MADLEDIEALALFADLFESGGLTESEFRSIKLQLLGTDHAPQSTPSVQTESISASPSVQTESISASPQFQAQTVSGATQFMVVLQLAADWESNTEKTALSIATALDDSIDDVRQVLVDRNSVIAISSDRREAEQAIIDLADQNIPAYLKIIQATS